MEWFYIKGGKSQGPVDEDGLRGLIRDGDIGPDDLVWNAGMGREWKRAAELGLVASPDGNPAPRLPDPVAAPRLSGPPSVASSVGVAWARMKAVLFSPFDAAKWFFLGFSAWLATLAEGSGGSSSNWNPGGSSGRSTPGGGEGGVEAGGTPVASEFETMIGKAREFWLQHSDMIIGIGAVVILLLVIISVVVLWLRCRGKFMLLDNVVNNRCDIADPWRRYRRLGNSLFLWSLVYSLVCLFIMLGILAFGVFEALIPCVKARAWVPSVVPAIVITGLLLLVFGVVSGYFWRFLDDFVVPIMYRNDLATTEAWPLFMRLLGGNFWRFVLYGVFRGLLAIGFGIALGLIGLVTCCIGLLLMATPYIRAVVTLPVIVFFRFYSLAYLEQFGEEYELRPRG